MELTKNSFKPEGINVRDEREFKLWVKFITSVNNNGGDINKPLDILWKSVQSEIALKDKKPKRIRLSIA